MITFSRNPVAQRTREEINQKLEQFTAAGGAVRTFDITVSKATPITKRGDAARTMMEHDINMANTRK
jgi:hypothetical protein